MCHKSSSRVPMQGLSCTSVVSSNSMCLVSVNVKSPGLFNTVLSGEHDLRLW